MSAKYPRTPHLPWSPGGTKDDRRLGDVSHLLERPLVLTEKLDGSNVCITSTDVFARSHFGPPRHPSFDALKALHAEVKHMIPSYLSIFGEWCFAVHSIEYESLLHHLNLFGIRDDVTSTWLEWNTVGMWACSLGVVTVPACDIDTMKSERDLKAWVELHASAPSRYGGVREGVVVRTLGPVSEEAFSQFAAKWVRAGHVQTDEHWSQQPIRRQRLLRDP